MTECCIADDKGDELPGQGEEEPGQEETAVRPPPDPCETDPSPAAESPGIDDIPAIDDIDMADWTAAAWPEYIDTGIPKFVDNPDIPDIDAP